MCAFAALGLRLAIDTGDKRERMDALRLITRTAFGAVW